MRDTSLSGKRKSSTSGGNKLEDKITDSSSEDMNSTPEVHEVEHDGKPVIRYVKVKGKVRQTAATQQAQETGVFGDEVGKDALYTTASGAADAAAKKAKKDQGDPEDSESPLKKSGGPKMLGMIRKAKAQRMEKAKPPEDKDPPVEPKTLNYKEINKIRAKPASGSLDYSKMKSVIDDRPAWKLQQDLKNERAKNTLVPPGRNFGRSQKSLTKARVDEGKSDEEKQATRKNRLKAPGEFRSVHLPKLAERGVSHTGDSVREGSPRSLRFAKENHKNKLEHLKNMKKPNLIKARVDEGMNPKQKRLERENRRVNSAAAPNPVKERKRENLRTTGNSLKSRLTKDAATKNPNDLSSMNPSRIKQSFNKEATAPKTTGVNNAGTKVAQNAALGGKQMNQGGLNKPTGAPKIPKPIGMPKAPMAKANKLSKDTPIGYDAGAAGAISNSSFGSGAPSPGMTALSSVGSAIGSLFKSVKEASIRPENFVDKKHLDFVDKKRLGQ